MAIGKLPKSAEEFINQGGSVSNNDQKNNETEKDMFRTIIRMPKSLYELIEKQRKKSLDVPPRNGFILSLLVKALKDME